jgi:hypothetical protein
VPLLLFGIVACRDRVAVFQDGQAEVERGADSMREHALKVFQTDRLAIELIDQRIRSMDWDEIAASRDPHEYLASVVTRYPELEGAWIADATGKVRSSSRFFPAPSTDVSSRDFFIADRESDKLAFRERMDD